MSRIADVFTALQAGTHPGLIAYVTAGDPDLARTAEILVALAANGADVIEVGIPFSDPLADGPVIQRASERALAGGATLRGALGMIRETRAKIAAQRASPNCAVSPTAPKPRARRPTARATAARSARSAGREAGPSAGRPIVDAGLDPIFLVSPTTTDARIRRSGELGRGLLYVISRLGVTGAREHVATYAEPLVKRIRAQSNLPLALGFGISRPEHVAEVCEYADAAVVGSALVNVIAEHGAAPDVAGRAGAYVRWLKGQA
jgi:tryptophan synthase alpha chain